VAALRQMTERGYRHLPAVADGRLVGILLHRDCQAGEIALIENEVGHEQIL
jgi:hypothetical protein